MVREPLFGGWFIHYSKKMCMNLFRRVSVSLKCLRLLHVVSFAIWFRAPRWVCSIVLMCICLYDISVSLYHFGYIRCNTLLWDGFVVVGLGLRPINFLYCLFVLCIFPCLKKYSTPSNAKTYVVINNSSIKQVVFSQYAAKKHTSRKHRKFKWNCF
jgi:hypothetical protein